MGDESITSRPVQRVVVVHGYQSAPDANWFPWLHRELLARGIDVTVVPLPDPDDPETTAWENAVRAALGVPDAGTVMVAHSLGAITTLRVLANLSEPWQLGALVLVAGFIEPLDALPELDLYLATGEAPRRAAAGSSGGRSFHGGDGVTSFPAVLHLILSR